MYYRRKILLSLLQVFDGQLEKVQLQKLLLLFSQLQQEADYNFVPYKYGCFSFLANADLGTLEKYGMVSDTAQHWKKVTPENFVPTLRKRDAEILKTIRYLYRDKPSEELIATTYRKYPYYAIKSKIAAKILTETEMNVVRSHIPVSAETCLYTIGYEGLSIEQYLNKLIARDVKVLCDVRKNSFSMKYGFSKSQLKTACEGVGIHFYHFPELGIDSENRQNLETQADRDTLFRQYRADVIPRSEASQQQILQLLQQHRRVAITCFEAAHGCCHRSHLADAIKMLPEFDYRIIHL